MKKFFLLASVILGMAVSSIAQVGINDDNSAPDPSAMLDVKSSDKGFLPPRMTSSQMNGIVAPIAGLLVYNTSVNALYWFDGANWQRFNEFNYTETDPVFLLHPASSIGSWDIDNWNAAYGWGNHALQGYLTSYAESDPVFEIHPTHSITQLLIDQWNDAYGWGNHALAGYLTSYTETDPLFYAHPASWISTVDLDQWDQAYNFRLLSATGSNPLSLNLSNNQLTGSIQPANALQSGYLTATDWNTFNNKQSALTLGNVNSSDLTITGGAGAVVGSGMALTVKKGNLTEATSSVLTITNGTNSVLGTSGTTIQVKQASSTQSGYLSSADWNTFNNKQSALTFGNLTSTDITVTGGTSAVKGSGATLAVKKGNLTETGSSVLTITNGANAVLGTSGTTLQVKQAGASQSGFLTAADWNSFNNKVSSQWTANGTKLHYNIGNVGVGTSNPGSKFASAGNAAVGSNYADLSTVPANGLAVEGKLGVGTPAPDASASLEVTSTTAGVLLPRMTRAQRNAIALPAEGLMVYCTNCGTAGALSIFTNGAWLTFSPCTTGAPAAGTPQLTQGQVIWNWQAVAGAAGYKWNTVADYETAANMGSALTKTETGTMCDTTYTRFVWAYSSCGESAMTALTATVPATPPDAPTDGTHTATQTSITWNWNTVAGATGYKWNNTNDYSTATDLGTANTYAETGDTCGTAYTRFVWAYNGCGYSVVDTLTQSTLPCWACGISTLTINHVTTGGVAPVNKTTTYGTVTNIPGETAKCWITSNLGSDHQATAVNDATEASAGWYWQFNRKQGYKHDGTTRTPNTTWISSINENSDWQTANDPCTLELGTAWRLPTYTEWNNVDITGGWTNWNGPWSSGLKLHAAGYLNTSNGALYSRGSTGNYWSSTQYSTDYGWYLNFSSGYSYVNSYYKAYGFSGRCLRD